MQLAIIEVGGKQYKIKSEETIKVEKISGGENETTVFERVLLVVDKKGKVKIGHPFLEGAKIEGKIVEQGRNKKVIVFKYKPKKRYQVKKGHRQPYSKVKIKSFSE